MWMGGGFGFEYVESEVSVGSIRPRCRLWGVGLALSRELWAHQAALMTV